MTFKRGDRVWVCEPERPHERVAGYVTRAFPTAQLVNVCTHETASMLSIVTCAEEALSSRTEHIPELDGGEAPRG